ncbi:hypothetical protein GJAV_G00182880 [Gymnothorax javanicus]|nr:hypothetical protein GJAV_G00182880 [Gymnothorax javanicus]
MLSDTDPLLPSCSELYQLGLTCVPDRDHSRDAASAVGERDGLTDDHAEQLVKPVRPTSKEFTKTWGFRRTTIAQRETPPDSVVQEAKRALARRSGRQAKRGHQASESVPTAKPGRGGRRSTPAGLGSPKPPSETSADADDPSEISVTAASIPVRPTEEPVETPRPSESKMPSGLSASEGATSSDQADSEELTLKELQERIRRRRKKDLIGPHRDAGSLRNQGEESSLDEAEDSMWPGPSPADTGQNPVSVLKPSEPGAERAASPSGQEEQGGSPSKLSGQSHCPDSLYCICRQKHNDRFMICCDRCDEWFHGDCVGISAAQGRRLERSGQEYTCPGCTQQKIAPAPARGPEGAQQEADPSSCLWALPSPDTKEDCGGDQAIKGKIERATNPGEKRRIKIFQPLEDSSGLPRCMGPGCGKSALPDSVYCGAECIIRHAAAAMKSLTSVKEPAAKGQAPKRPATKSAAKGQKRSLRERAGRRSLESSGRTEEDESSSGEEAAVEPNQTSPLWSHDRNCIAAKPENTTAIPSAVFYKAFGLEREAMMKKELASAQLKPPHSFPKGDGQTPTTGDSPPKRTKLVSQPLSTTGRPNGDASRLSKASCKVPGKPSTPQHPPPAPPPLAGLPSSAPAAPSPLPQSPPNLTVRHNARRSLVEILNKRVSDCDDLDVPERNVLKIAVGIEKELYGLFLSTGHNYKNKYRSIMFNLKDPKKKGLFYQVMMGKVTPFKLVRLSAEELSAKDMFRWTPREKAEASEGSPRAWSGRLKAVLKLENSPVSDMDDSSPLPGDTCVPPAASSPSTGSAPERPGRSTASAPVNIRQASASVFSTMLTDTTAEHRTHLFNLSCRICTGRVSEEEEPAAKRLKTSDDEKDEPEAIQLVEGCSGHDSSPAAPDSQTYIMESPASPDDPSSAATSSQPITIPAVACVVIAGRDPRTAGYRPPVTSAIAPPVTSAIAPPVPATVPPAAIPAVPSVSDSNQDMAPPHPHRFLPPLRRLPNPS